MTIIRTRLLAAVAAAGALTAAIPALAQTGKVATIDSPDALFNNKALPTALQQIETKYAAQIKSAGDRSTALQAQLKPLYDALDTNKDGQLDQAEQQAAVQAQRPQVKQIQDAQTAAQTELDKLVTPVQIARIYVFDQLQQRYSRSLDGLVTARQIGLVLPAGGAIRSAPGTDLTAAVRTEIDKPLAIDPPAGWQPTREAAGLLETYLQAVQQQAQARAAQQAQQGTAPATTPTTTPPATARPGRDRNGDPIKR